MGATDLSGVMAGSRAGVVPCRAGLGLGLAATAPCGAAGDGLTTSPPA
eukprot:CAMPEP_0180290122 /NCGR_PEP_ID=MMETSP0988-20121125/15205_1 /TAXON_ID=697907 /ORGANISM="non described non described, Strain CCMP2293" /LENGTH=47 /DNA_ID= /DNA_START= /DNA_END= /DNA_ORIENTATION=